MRLAALLCALVCIACDPPPAPDDAGTDTGPPPMCETAIPPFMHGGDGNAEPLGSGSGEVRAGRAEASDLPTTPTGLEVWAAGDFILANDRVAIVIEDADSSDLYDRFGGRPVGLGLVRGGDLVQPADFNEVLFGISTYMVRTERVSVLSDGSSGPATIRATGPLGPIDFAGSLLTAFSGGNFDRDLAAIDYTLAADSNSIDVTLRVANARPQSRAATRMLMAFFQAFRMTTYAPGTGFGDFTGGLPFVGFDDEWGGAGWGWRAPPDRVLTGSLNMAGVSIADLGRAVLAPCEVTSIPLGSIVIGDGVAGVQAAIARAAGGTLRTLTGRVTEADGTTPASDARVHIEVDGAYYTRVAVAEDGTYRVEIPMAGAARATPYRRAFPTTLLDVPAGASPTLDLRMPAFGSIHVLATEGGMGVPARVQVFPASGAPTRPPATYGERAVTSGRLHVEFPTTGDVTVRVPPGSYRVIVSRGYEYELFDDGAVTVTAGATTEVAASLDRSVDTPGVICADYHLHTTRSPDSPDDGAFKVASLAADGLEIAVRTDHEFVNDFQPVIDRLGLSRHVRGLTGEELTTFEWGHFGVFPLVQSTEPNGSAVNWVGRRPPEVFDEVRSRPEAPAFIINHPRSTNFAQGYFEVVGFDALTGMVEHPSDWDDEFTIIEAFNDSSFDQNRESTVRDWFAFLNRGRRMFVIGSSDSHSLYGSPVGYPRTCLDLGGDDPQVLTPMAVRDATVAGHGVVAGGIYMTVEGPGGAGPGDEATGVGAMAMVRVVVRAASWIDVDSLEVIVDGATTETITLTRSVPDPTLLLDQMIAVPVAAATTGSWVVFHASGDDDMALVHPGREPFAVSNPIFLRR